MRESGAMQLSLQVSSSFPSPRPVVWLSAPQAAAIQQP